tara:strand:- start:427 stop:1353 length:927 start_codon:yes stop_codon:yes gene_type:complete
MKILVTGGAGYIGSTLVPELLAAGHEVCVYDALLFGGNSMFPHFKNKNFSLVEGDIRDTEKLRSVVEGKDVVIHLAAIVGYPACEKDHAITTAVNLEATKSLVDMLNDDQIILFGSTGSNYGRVDGICTEESPLNPLSIYGTTKTEAEQYIMNNANAVAYRFATAFGLSPRLRLDLLVNDFTKKAVKDRYIVVYESHFMRTFIHVYDIARSFMFALENLDKMIGNVYNVGSDKMNFSKKEVCEKINEVVPYFLHLADIGEDADKRDYVVSYDKIASLGFDTTIDLDSGISELAQGISVIKFDNQYSNV